MPKITVIIPTFNEIKHINAVLKEVTWADQLLIVDSYSTDGTFEIAQKVAHTFLQRDYIHSASQKNWTIPQAKHDWIFLLDADERLQPELLQSLLDFQKLSNEEVDSQYTNVSGFWIKRSNFFMGKRIKHSGWGNDKVIRLFKKECRYQNKHVHAEIITNGTFTWLPGIIDHYTYKGLNEHMAKLSRYADWQAADYDEKTGTLTPYHFIIKPFWSWFSHYIIQGGFKDGVPGLVIAWTQGYKTFFRYAKIWEVRRLKKSKPQS